jgi:hypothetical protein
MRESLPGSFYLEIPALSFIATPAPLCKPPHAPYQLPHSAALFASSANFYPKPQPGFAGFPGIGTYLGGRVGRIRRNHDLCFPDRFYHEYPP